jgi:hypothetical protein
MCKPWQKFPTLFHDSETILLARLQLLAAALLSVMIVTDLSPLLPPKYVTIWLLFSATVTELLRRR